MEEPNLGLPVSFVLFLGIVVTSCFAYDVEHLHDLKWQEKYMEKHFPRFTHPATADHMLQMLRWAHNSKRDSYAKMANEIYRNPNISKMAAKKNYGPMSSPTCWTQIQQLNEDVAFGRSYAQYVEDSTGRQASGLLRGDYLWLGKYYECKGQTDRSGELVTKMCLAVITDEKDSTSGLFLGTCFPEICTEEQVTAYLELVFGYTSYATVFCSDEKPYTSADIAAICVFSILAFFVLVGTICETVFICLDMYYVEENPFHEARKRSLPAYLLLCFSMIKNTKALMNTERKESTISVLDGIRFFSMAWVILGHTAYFSLSSLGNALDVLDYSLDHIGGQVIINGTFSVDSFFFLSGLLVTYLAMREIRRSGSLNIPVMYILRYLRLTPTVVLIMLLSSSLYLRLAEEPFYELRMTDLAEYCQKYWWTNLLYINNLYPENFGLGCISWVWYLANDWQFFLLSPLFIYLLYKYPISGFAVMGIFLVGSIAVTGALASHYELYPDVITYATISKLLLLIYKPRPQLPPLPLPDTNQTYGIDDSTTPQPADDDGTNDYFSDIYAKPWCRIGAYLIGMAAGYILFTTNKKIKMHLGIVITLWVAAIAVGLTLIYGWWGTFSTISLIDRPSTDLAAFYEAVKRPTWALCLMWLTIACSIGYGGPINSILSWNVFMPLSRLTFCAYLIHPLVIFYMYTAREVEVHFRFDVYIYYYTAALTLSYAAAYVLHVLAEAPFGGLTKAIFYTPQGRKPWYAIFNINVSRRPDVVPIPTNGDGVRAENGVERRKSHEKSGLPSPYTNGNDKKRMAFENPTEVHDEIELQDTNRTDERTAL